MQSTCKLLVPSIISVMYLTSFNSGWASKNSNNVGSRSVSTALYNSELQNTVALQNMSTDYFRLKCLFNLEVSPQRISIAKMTNLSTNVEMASLLPLMSWPLYYSYSPRSTMSPRIGSVTRNGTQWLLRYLPISCVCHLFSIVVSFVEWWSYTNAEFIGA